ncbi:MULTISPECIES: hypothetical protein [Lysobacter]|jgi:hypothetical protein|uniref:hypothetical protein n=1 Tax=Lysobacter TaxID=68 RepID=UPI001F1A21E9|nr:MULTISPECIES: hypothetical protein [Lysobacter]UJB19769.1 hypothetical protein L1A79_01315 [Lysobacter capsici]UJQ26505.1 hypothetical protein L2D09_13545 [Lysobacter gummosus]
MNAIILGQGNPYLKNPYLSKLSKVLDSARIPYEFWIWSRDKQNADLPKVKVLLSFGSWGGGAVNALGYALWMAWLTVRVFFQPRAGVYFCSRLDAALPCAIVASLRRCRFVFLDRDKLSKSYAWPAPVKRAIEAIERFIGRKASLHVVPGASRADGNDGDNVRIVRNTPHSDVIARARQMAAARPYRDGRLRVLVSGLISPERGARMMREAMEATAGRIEFVGAGRLLGEDAQSLAQQMGANYRGIVSNEDALAMLLSADVVLAFYDPALEINRLAEPNKWFDCAALEIPFFTNPGLSTSAPFEQAQACFLVEYGDGARLAQDLLRIDADRSLLDQRRDGLRQLRYEAWDTAMARVVAECAQLPS